MACDLQHRSSYHFIPRNQASNAKNAKNKLTVPQSWLGHQDGGALCMKTYGHLRDEHSANEAKKVAF